MNRKQLLAWAAGLVDGEGCISIDYKRKPKEYRHPSFRLRLRVNMTHKRTVYRLRFILGGTVRKRERANSRCKDQYVWSLNGQKARSALLTILPFLYTKKKDAILGIRFRDFMDSVVTPGRGAYPKKVIDKQYWFYMKLRKKFGKHWTAQ